MRVKTCILTGVRVRNGALNRLNHRGQCTHKKRVTTEHALGRGWEPVIGIEIHAQIQAESKLFSGAGTKYGEPVNCLVSFMDCALPGTLPTLNKKCVEAGVVTALALNCHINHVSYFDRKHYFYADMPSGYQITQQRQPLAENGRVSYLLNGLPKEANITQLQLEQDSGKSLHDPEAKESLIDLNRAGVGLMEIVTDPDFRSSSETRAFVKELLLILTTIGTCSCKMEEGKFRIDASVSLHRSGEPLGTRCEVKNLNSVSFMGKAIDYEIARQLEILEGGGEVENETRTFDSGKSETVPMRDKEKVHDYRFMPEPNLLPLRIYDNLTVPSHIDDNQVINVDVLRDSMPLLPVERRHILQQNGVSVGFASQIVSTPGHFDLYCELTKKTEVVGSHIEDVLSNVLPRALKCLTGDDERGIPVTHKQLADVINLRIDQLVTKEAAFKLLAECVGNEEMDVHELVEKCDLKISNNKKEIEILMECLIRDNMGVVGKLERCVSEKKVQRYTKILRTIALEKSCYKHDPELLYRILDDMLKEVIK